MRGSDCTTLKNGGVAPDADDAARGDSEDV